MPARPRGVPLRQRSDHPDHIFARWWSRFTSERDFYRYASGHLREAFPTLPDRSQFNRLVRFFYANLVEKMALHLAKAMEAWVCPYETLDTSAIPIRDAKRRGEGDGWPATPTLLDGAIAWAHLSHPRRESSGIFGA